MNKVYLLVNDPPDEYGVQIAAAYSSRERAEATIKQGDARLRRRWRHDDKPWQQLAVSEDYIVMEMDIDPPVVQVPLDEQIYDVLVSEKGIENVYQPAEFRTYHEKPDVLYDGLMMFSVMAHDEDEAMQKGLMEYERYRKQQQGHTFLDATSCADTETREVEVSPEMRP